MNYLAPSEYESYGLEATTLAAWVTAASAVIDAHCRRATLAVAQYEERLRITAGRNTVRVTYVPLATVAPATTPIISARGRYAIPRRGEWPFDDLSSDVALMFGLPGTWNTVDPAGIDVYADTGELTLPVNAVGLGYSEIDLVYTAGLDTISCRGESCMRSDRSQCTSDSCTELAFCKAGQHVLRLFFRQPAGLNR